jgi:hypothetical protein
MRSFPFQCCFTQLLGRDLVALDGVLLGMESAHIGNEGLGDLGRKFDEACGARAEDRSFGL